MPSTVIKIPIQVFSGGISPKNTTASRAVRICPLMKKTMSVFGPKSRNAAKKRVSPTAIPSIPLKHRRITLFREMESYPIKIRTMPSKKILTSPLLNVIPKGEAISPTRLNRMAPAAQEAADSNAALMPITSGFIGCSVADWFVEEIVSVDVSSRPSFTHFFFFFPAQYLKRCSLLRGQDFFYFLCLLIHNSLHGLVVFSAILITATL